MKLIALQGLQGSGKTTWALNMLAKHPGAFKRVNKDELRALLDGDRNARVSESFILEAEDMLVRLALHHGISVIVDDTNLNPFHVERLKAITQEFPGCEFEVNFFDVDIDECIRRDATREHSVGEKVIRDTQKSFLNTKAQ